MKTFQNKHTRRLTLGIIIIIMTACDSAQEIKIFHNPSEIFFSEKIKLISTYSPHTVKDIYFTIDIKEAEFDEYYIWLGAYTSSKNREIDILKSSLFFGTTHIENKINEKIILGTKTDTKNIYQNSMDSFRLMTINPSTSMQFLKEKGERKLVLSVIVDGMKFIITFDLEIKTEKYTVFPT